MNPFRESADITILTNDRDASWAVWEMSNAAKEKGEKSFELTERMEKSLSLDRVHELWIIVNDALKTGTLLLALYGAFKALKPKDGRRITIRFGTRVEVGEEDRKRFRALGIELSIERSNRTDEASRSKIK